MGVKGNGTLQPFSSAGWLTFSWHQPYSFNGSQSITSCSTHFSEYQDTSKKMRLFPLQVAVREVWKKKTHRRYIWSIPNCTVLFPAAKICARILTKG